MSQVLITTVPFGEIDPEPRRLLGRAGIEYTVNPLGRKLCEDDVVAMVLDNRVIIAGTEPITAKTFEKAPNLGLISRVGIGLDSVDLIAAEKYGVLVSYTPDAPGPAVAELTIGMMVSLLRHTPQADRHMRKGHWYRFVGRRLSEITVGIIGVGRVGKKVVAHLESFGPRILANDLTPDLDFGARHSITWTDKETIYRDADIITLHVPLTRLTGNLISERELAVMKPDALLINTSRGGIVNEPDLTKALTENRIAGAALDVFEEEPYHGPLIKLENCLLCSHMGSMSADCRFRMELEATQEAIRFVKGEPLQGLVPEAEYDVQRQI